MKNFVQEGRSVSLTAPDGGVVSGQGILTGALFGIAQHSAAAGAPFECAVAGVFNINKSGSQAWTEGQLIYWENTLKLATNAGAGNTLIGHAVKAVGSASTDVVGMVRLSGSG